MERTLKGLVLSQDKLVIFRVTTITVKKLMIPKVKPESKYRHATDAVAKHATGERGSQELRQTEKIETSSKFSWAAHLLFELNAFKHEADTKPWRDIILTWIYITFVFVCVIAVIIAYANRDAIEEWRLQSQDDSDVPSIPIVVATECSSSWGCYDNWGSSHPSFVHVRHAYSTIAAQKKCDHNFNDTIASRNARAQFSSRICYSSVYRDGLDIDIPFDAALTYGANQALSVTITSPSSKLFVSVDVEPSQRKTIFISQWLKERRKKSLNEAARQFFGVWEPQYAIDEDTGEPYQADLFYDGKNANATALLRIRATQFCNVATVGKQGTVIDLFAKIGGMNSMAFLIVKEIRKLFLKPKFPGPGAILSLFYS